MISDRAARFATAMAQIFGRPNNARARAEAAAYLRDEIADLVRTVWAEIKQDEA